MGGREPLEGCRWWGEGASLWGGGLPPGGRASGQQSQQATTGRTRGQLSCDQSLPPCPLTPRAQNCPSLGVCLWPRTGCTGPLMSTMPRHRRAAATRAGARPALSQELQFFHCLDDPGLTPSTGLCAVTGPCCIQASAGHPGQLTEAEDCWFP